MFDKRVLLAEEDEASGGGGQQVLFKEEELKQDPDRLERLEKAIEAQNKKLDDQGQFFSGFFRQPQQQHQRPQQNPDAKKQFEEQFFQDPIRGTAQVAQHVASQQAAAIQAQLHPFQVKMAREEARGLDSDVYDKYKGEIEAQVQSTYGPEHWGNPFVWTQALKAVKADKFDEIAQLKAEKKKAATSINAPSRRGFTPGGEQQGLTAEQKQMADWLGMDHSKYEAAVKEYHSDKSAPATGRDMLKSGWANVITLDSRKPRQKKTA